MNAAAAILAALVLAGPPAESQLSGSELHIRHCVVAAIDDIPTPAQDAGVLRTLHVKPGQHVKLDEPLASIDKTDAELAVEAAVIQADIAEQEASDDVEVRAADAAYKVAEKEVEETEEINRRAPGTVAKTQVRREQLTADRAKLQHEAAEKQFQIAGKTLSLRRAEQKAAQHNLGKRDVLAPTDGVVVQILRRPGEWVQPGDPVMRVVRMSKLRVEGFVSSKQFAPYEIDGKPVTITIKLRRGEVKVLTGNIQFVSPVVEGSGDFRVWLDIDNIPVGNHWMFWPGQDAEMRISVGSVVRTAVAP